mgnify:CR=1 FL=1
MTHDGLSRCKYKCKRSFKLNITWSVMYFSHNIRKQLFLPNENLKYNVLLRVCLHCISYSCWMTFSRLYLQKKNRTLNFKMPNKIKKYSHLKTDLFYVLTVFQFTALVGMYPHHWKNHARSLYIFCCWLFVYLILWKRYCYMFLIVIIFVKGLFGAVSLKDACKMTFPNVKVVYIYFIKAHCWPDINCIISLIIRKINNRNNPIILTNQQGAFTIM